MVRELIHHRMDTVGDEDEDGNTPLHLACIKGYPGVARVLLDAKADIEARSVSVCVRACVRVCVYVLSVEGGATSASKIRMS